MTEERQRTLKSGLRWAEHEPSYPKEPNFGIEVLQRAIFGHGPCFCNLVPVFRPGLEFLFTKILWFLVANNIS